MAKKRQPINTDKLPKKKGRPRKVPVPQAPATLTAKERRFVEEYCVRFNGTQAAIHAGYSKRSAGEIAYELLKKPQIAAAVEKYLADRAAYTGKSKDDIEREMELLAFGRATNFHRFTEDGEPVIDLSDASRDELAAITELETHDYVDGRGENARDVKKVRFKMADKRQALMDLAKLRGHVIDKGEMKVDMTARQRQEIIQAESPETLRQVLEALRKALPEAGV